MAGQSTIATIATTILNLAIGFENPTSVAADLADAALLFNSYEKVAPNTVFGNTVSGLLAKASASEANLASGQVAQVASYGASFNGEADTVDVYCVRRSALSGGDLVILPSSVTAPIVAAKTAQTG